MIEATQKIGVGLYTAAEAARYVRAQPEAISRWLFGSARGEAVIDPQFAPDQERIVTFLDMVQSLAIRSVRVGDRKVSLAAIRDAVKEAEDNYDIQNPLARKHTLYHYDKGIWIRLEKSRDYLGVSKADKGQRLLPIVEPYLEEIEYDAGGLADSWTPLTYKDYSITLDPNLRFGQPVVAPLKILAGALAETAAAEGSIDAAAEVHGVDRSAVALAVKYFDSLTGLAA